MNPVREQIVSYYQQMEQAQSEEERLRIKQARQDYYDSLSKADQQSAREAAEPFLDKLIHQIEQEVDPLLEKLDAVFKRMEVRNATAHTTESVTRQ